MTDQDWSQLGQQDRVDYLKCKNSGRLYWVMGPPDPGGHVRITDPLGGFTGLARDPRCYVRVNWMGLEREEVPVLGAG